MDGYLLQNDWIDMYIDHFLYSILIVLTYLIWFHAFLLISYLYTADYEGIHEVVYNDSSGSSGAFRGHDAWGPFPTQG
jgi:hypothetical protein